MEHSLRESEGIDFKGRDAAPFRVHRSQFEMSRKNCCEAVRGWVYGLVAAGRLGNGPVTAGAVCKLKPALVQLSTS